jgi:hypothetical protein
MYKVAITQRQGKNSEYKTTEKVRIHGNFLELQLGVKTKYIALNGVEEITQTKIADEGEPGEVRMHAGRHAYPE